DRLARKGSLPGYLRMPLALPRRLESGRGPLCPAFFHTYHLPTLVTNCSNNYGPYQYPEKLIPLMVRRAIEGVTLPVYGDGSNVRDWIHVDDHVRGLEMALARGEPGEEYLFGGDCERSNLDIVKALCVYLDQLSPLATGRSYAEQIRFVKDRPGHDQRYAISSVKARQLLDWQPLVEFEPGLKETVEWFLNHRGWMDQVTRNVYEGNRLGLQGG
ncbi:MAG: GDP-mannose 4,6-dehydratase, partial [Pirellulaceae bacterium]